MKPFIEDLKILGSYKAYTFSLPNYGLINLRGGILAFLADTPASNKAGGFNEGVGGARRKSRHCMVNFQDMQSFFVEDAFQLRDIENHLQQLAEIENAASEDLKEFFLNSMVLTPELSCLKHPFSTPASSWFKMLCTYFLKGF